MRFIQILDGLVYGLAFTMEESYRYWYSREILKYQAGG